MCIRDSLINHVRDVMRYDSKQYALLIQDMLHRVKYLIHCSVIIQKIRFWHIRYMADAEKLLHIIDIGIIFLSFAPDSVFQLYGNIVAVDLLNAPPLALLYGRLKLAPGNVVIIRVDRHMLQRRVISLLIRLDRRADPGALYLAQRILMKVANVVQSFQHIRIGGIHEPCIEVYRLLIRHMEHDFKNRFV